MSHPRKGAPRPAGAAYDRDMVTKAAGLLGAALLAASLAACGSSSSTVAQDTSGSTGPSPMHSSGAAHTGPACLTVWRSGATLPHGYHGCTTTAGWVSAQTYQCSDGHHLVTYAHRFYAAPGRTISRAATTLAHDHGFQHTMKVCGA